MATALVITATSTVDGNALILHVRHLDVLHGVVLASDPYAIADSAAAAVDRQVADRGVTHASQLEAGRGAAGGTQHDALARGALDGHAARRREIVLGIRAGVNRQGIATAEPAECLGDTVARSDFQGGSVGDDWEQQ